MFLDHRISQPLNLHIQRPPLIMAEETKTCTTCHETRDIEEFHRNSQFPDGHTYRCRTCTRAYCQRRWRNNIICSSRAADRRRWSADAIANYGAYLTIERVDELLVMQQGQCFYCGVPLMYGTGIDRSTHRAGVTIERADNAVPHVIENCVLACSSCNTARSADYTFNEFMEHHVNIKLTLIKRCNGECGEIKPTADFHHQGAGRFQPKCRVCRQRYRDPTYGHTVDQSKHVL
jgi:hypothetical protein